MTTTSYDWKNALRLLGLQDGKENAFIEAQIEAVRAIDPAWAGCTSVKVIALLMAANRQALAIEGAAAADAIKRSAASVEDRIDFAAKRRAEHHAEQAIAAIQDGVRKEVEKLVRDARATLQAADPSVRAMTWTGALIIALILLVAGMLLGRWSALTALPLPAPGILQWVAVGAAGTIGLGWAIRKMTS